MYDHIIIKENDIFFFRYKVKVRRLEPPTMKLQAYSLGQLSYVHFDR